MQSTRRAGPAWLGIIPRVVVGTVALTALACGRGEQGAGPNLPGEPPPNPQFSKAAYIFDVNTARRTVNITAPNGATFSTVLPSNGKPGPSLSIQAPPSFSIVAGDVALLTVSNYFASNVGDFIPNKIRVRFDVSITNRLSSVQLITPTFPPPPAGVDGILLFPFSTTVTQTTGGASVGGDGTDIIIELPNRGQTAPSTDWDGTGSAGSGAPFNFFNDADCTAAGANDCYRWEAFAEPLAAGATSTARTVGFDIDPTVSSFRARLILAADLQNSGPAPVGTISGSVTSPLAGPLTGVTITATPGTGLTGTSGAGGAYTIPSVPIGPKTVAITSGLPAGCTNPGSQNVTITNGVTTTVNFVVTCPGPSGSVVGSITRTGAGTQSLAGVLLTATPAAAGTSPASAAATGAASPFSYSISGVAVGLGAGAGNGSVSLGTLPAGCTNPGPGSYTGLTSGGTVTVNFTVDCVVPPSFYQLSSSWGTISGGKVSLTITFDPTTRNDPAVNGAAADDINGFSGNVNWGTSRLAIFPATGAGSDPTATCVKPGSSPFDAVFVFNNAFATNTFRIVAASSGAGATTPTVIAVCTFNVLAGTATTVTTATSSLQITSFNGGTPVNLTPNTQTTEATLSIP
jgi:hypothetical protein